MNVSQLRKALKVAESHYRSDGHVDIADGLSAFETNLLGSHDDKSVAAFVTSVERARILAAQRLTTQTRRRRR